MEWTQLFTIALGAILVNNFIVAQFLGICPFMGVSKKIETASGMGLAVIFVMGLASAICWPINELILRSCPRSIRIMAETGPDLHADRDLHSGHRLSGAVHRDVPQEGHALPL